jgi:uncharacterized protein (DUF433 family)
MLMEMVAVGHLGSSSVGSRLRTNNQLSQTMNLSEERRRAIALANRHSSGKKSTKIVHDGFLTIDIAPFWTSVDKRLQRPNAARAQVSIDDQILGGTPIIRGTRVPVYDVARSIAAGYAMERILSSYPSLNREQVELAALFAEANPPRGRPRQRIVPTGVKVISSRRKPRSVPRRRNFSSTNV